MYLAYNGPEELVDIFNLPSCDAGTIVQMLITSLYAVKHLNGLRL